MKKGRETGLLRIYGSRRRDGIVQVSESLKLLG